MEHATRTDQIRGGLRSERDDATNLLHEEQADEREGLPRNVDRDAGVAAPQPAR